MSGETGLTSTLVSTTVKPWISLVFLPISTRTTSPLIIRLFYVKVFGILSSVIGTLHDISQQALT